MDLYFSVCVCVCVCAQTYFLKIWSAHLSLKSYLYLETLFLYTIVNVSKLCEIQYLKKSIFS